MVYSPAEVRRTLTQEGFAGITLCKIMSAVHLEIEMPGDLARFQLPSGVGQRLQALLDRQDSGQALTDSEREEADGLVNLSEMLSLLRLRSERLSGHNT